MTQKLRILYILPHYGLREQAKDAVGAMDWSDTEFNTHEIDPILADPEAQGYIFHRPGKRLGKPLPGTESWKDVMIQEMLLMAIRWRREHDLDVDIYSWDKFRKLFLGEFETFVSVATTYDLVFGGADLTVAGYEFESDEQESIYLYRMTRLDGMTAVFSNPTMSWASRFKANVIEDLDAIANKITNSARPFTRLLHSADDKVNFQLEALKRGGSAERSCCAERKREALAEAKFFLRNASYLAAGDFHPFGCSGTIPTNDLRSFTRPKCQMKVIEVVERQEEASSSLCHTSTTVASTNVCKHLGDWKRPPGASRLPSNYIPESLTFGLESEVHKPRQSKPEPVA
ncbi:hypothetical protein B0H14DRAFT_2592092 [Mycena olivaceomarginata]|nr:hypothetical protein B0H14DRAFT_2592092 [Mycena olivaceomarginata]